MKSVASKLTSVVKTAVVVALATLSFSAFAYPMYVGNPTRPDTIWIPAHCEGGCYKEGYYVKFLDTPDCSNVAWVGDHFEPRNTRIVGHY